MRRQHFIVAVIITMLLFSGCTSLSLTGPDILSPPQAEGRRAEIQRMIEQDAKGSYTLIYPASGPHKNGIILQDLNDDGTDEAIALYTASDGTPRLLMAIKQDDSYTLYGSASLRSANVSRLDFADVDADGKEDLILGFDCATPLASIEAFVNGEGLTVAEGFTDYVIGDFDGNSAADILLLTNLDKKNAAASLTVYTDGAFAEKSSCDTDPTILSYFNLHFDKISDGLDGAVADGKRADGEYTTQLLYYDSAAHLLVNPLYLNNSYSRSVRTSPVSCADIDEDGVIEVPVCSLMPYTKGEDAESVCSLVTWCGYDSDAMSLYDKQCAVLCEKPGFMLLLDGAIAGSVTARCSDGNTVRLYDLSYDKNNTPVIGGELLTIKLYDKNSFDSSLTAEATLYENAANIYTCIIGEDSPFTYEDVKNSFKLLEADEISS